MLIKTIASSLQIRNWFILTKILIGMVTVTVLPMGVLTALNAHALRQKLRQEIGAEFETMAIGQMNHLADILQEQMTLLNGIALIDKVRSDVSEAELRYTALDPKQARWATKIAQSTCNKGSKPGAILFESPQRPRSLGRAGCTSARSVAVGAHFLSSTFRDARNAYLACFGSRKNRH